MNAWSRVRGWALRLAGATGSCGGARGFASMRNRYSCPFALLARRSGRHPWLLRQARLQLAPVAPRESCTPRRPPCPRPTAAAALSTHGGLGVASLRSLSPVDRRRYHERAGRWPGGAPRRRRLVVRMACAAWIRWDCSSRYVSPSVRCDRLTFSSFQHEALGIALSFPSRARAAMVGNLSTTYACVVVSW
jgi:hypothetical protein